MSGKSPHDDCTAHSGLSTRVNVQIVLSGIATVLLGVLLNVAVGLRSDVNANIEKANGDIRLLSQKVEVLAWRIDRIEGSAKNFHP